MTPWQTLQRRFSATRLLRRADDTESLRPGGRVTEWVVPRGQCTYQCVDVAQVPAKRLDGFIALAVKRSVPFPSPQWHAVTRGDKAMVWAWPGAMLETPTSDGRSWNEGDRALPEAVLRDAPRDDGLALIAMDTGLDARIWRGGVLVASQWFPDVPAATAWRRFLRGAGWTGAAECPEVEAAPWRAQPWTASKPPLVTFRDWRTLRTPLAIAAALAAAVAIGWPIGQGLRHAWSARSTEARIDALAGQLGEVLDARDAAQRQLVEVQDLLALRAAAPQLDLIAELAALWRERGFRVAEWDVQQGRRLRLVLNAPGADPQAVVREAQQTGRLGQVAVEPGASPEQLVLVATLARPTTP